MDNIQTLQEKIRKMELGLKNPSIAGPVKDSLEAALEKARTELAKMEQPSTTLKDIVKASPNIIIAGMPNQSTVTAVAQALDRTPKVDIASMPKQPTIEETPTKKVEPIEEQPEPAAPEEAEPTPMPAPPVESPAAIEAAITAVMPKICAVTRNMQQNGVEIRFPKQPSEGLTAQLKAKGFRWSRNKGVWYVKYTESIHKWALDFCGSTENTDNPGSIETPKGGRVRLITRAVLTSKGKVPQALLRSEIEADKMEMAVFRDMDMYQNQYKYIKKEDMQWVDATMQNRSVDIQELNKGHLNKYYDNSIIMEDDGIIQFGSLKLRYKSDVENYDYTPQAEKEKEQEAKAAQEKVKTELVSQIVDLNPARYHVPSNRPAKKGDFEIEYEEALNPTDFIGKGEIPGIVAIDGYRLVGTMEAQNVVTSIMVSLIGNQRTERREDKWIFKAEKGTVTPGFLSFAKFRQAKEGEKSDFPGWIAPSSPHDVWDSLKWTVSDAVTELNKSKDPKKTDRGRKGHANKAAVSIQRITLIKKIWVEYELKYPGRLIQVTGQSAYEYAKMMSLWMADLDMKVAEVAPVVERVPAPQPMVVEVPNTEAQKVNIDELKSRLKLLTKMVEKATDENKAVLNARIKLITKMIGNG